MRFLLSIKTVFPKPGGRIWYDDQRKVHRQIYEGDETVDHAFMGHEPDRWLRDAFWNQSTFKTDLLRVLRRVSSRSPYLRERTG